jgi:hypothetical protein
MGQFIWKRLATRKIVLYPFSWTLVTGVCCTKTYTYIRIIFFIIWVWPGWEASLSPPAREMGLADLIKLATATFDGFLPLSFNSLVTLIRIYESYIHLWLVDTKDCKGLKGRLTAQDFWPTTTTTTPPQQRSASVTGTDWIDYSAQVRVHFHRTMTPQEVLPNEWLQSWGQVQKRSQSQSLYHPPISDPIISMKKWTYFQT